MVCIKYASYVHGWWLTIVIPALQEAEEGGSPKGRNQRPAWPTLRNTISTKNTKISWAWWHVAIIPATWETEEGESLEPRRQRLQLATLAPLHSSLGDRVTLHLKTYIYEQIHTHTHTHTHPLWFPLWRTLTNTNCNLCFDSLKSFT